MIKETSRKVYNKIVETWLTTTSTTSKVDESDLEIIFMLMCDSKSIMRCDACLQSNFKYIMLIEEDGDPYYPVLLVLSGTEKVK